MKQSTLRKLLEDVAATETAITGADPAPMPDVPETDAPNKGDEVLELLREIRDLLANVYGGEEQEELVIPEETAVTEPEAEEPALKESAKFSVVVGNIGNVYDGNNREQAAKAYSEYVKQSKTGYGRAAGEDVTFFSDGEIFKEHVGERSAAETD